MVLPKKYTLLYGICTRILFNILSKENYKFYASGGILMGSLFHWKRVLRHKYFYPIETEPLEIVTYSIAPRFSFGTTLGLGTQFKIRSLWYGIVELNQELSISSLGIGIDWQSRNFGIGIAKLFKS